VDLAAEEALGVFQQIHILGRRIALDEGSRALRKVGVPETEEAPSPTVRRR